MDAGELIEVLKPYIVREEKEGAFTKVFFNRYVFIDGDGWGVGRVFPVKVAGFYRFVYNTYYIDSAGKNFEYYLVEEEDILRVKMEGLVDTIGEED